MKKLLDLCMDVTTLQVQGHAPLLTVSTLSPPEKQTMSPHSKFIGGLVGFITIVLQGLRRIHLPSFCNARARTDLKFRYFGFRLLEASA